MSGILAGHSRGRANLKMQRDTERASCFRLEAENGTLEACAPLFKRASAA
jgi:hypothetical protein